MSESISSQYLVPSKLSVPYLPPNAIHRSRLDEEFIRACQKSLVVLSAPAGFGKTTAVLHGAKALKEQQPDTRLAWVSLDPEDTDPNLFAAYFISAIAKQIRLSEQLTHSGVHEKQAQLKSLFGQLLFELDRSKQPLIIVLDDYHLIDNEEVHQAIAYFTKHIPTSVTLVLTTRSDPPASIMTLRLQGLVADINAETLGFTIPETQSFFQHLGGGFQLAENDVKQLLEHVEGWAVGLQLIVLGLKTKPSFDELKARLDQKDLNAIDYFESEVFDALPEDVKQFMLSTSIVKRFNVDIGEALTQNINVHEVLEFLQRQNLFIVQFNEPQQWFRYHHLLREFLQHKLNTALGDDVKALHFKASNAFLTMGYIVGAVDHAIRSQDQDQIVSILVNYGDDLIHKAHYELVKSCLVALPDSVIASNSQLTLVYCWVEAISGDPKRVQPMLDMAVSHIHDQSMDAEILKAEYETVQSQAFYGLGLYRQAEEAAKAALELFPDKNTRRQSALLTYANVKFEQGELDRALSIYEESEVLSRQEGNHDAVLWSLNQQAQIWKQRCDFSHALQLAKEVQEYAAAHNVSSGYNACFSLYCQAELALEAYHLREARLIINDVNSYVQNWDEFWQQHSYGWLLKMEMLKGKPTVARELSAKHERILAREDVAEHLISYSMEVQLMYWWQNEETKKIETWLKTSPVIKKPVSARDYSMMRAQLYGHIACHRYEEALQRIEQIYEPLREYEGRPFQFEFIRLGILLVALLNIQGRKEEAENELLLLLQLIQQNSIVASILYLRNWIMPLFEDMALETLPEDQSKFVEQLLILYKQRNTSSRRGEEEVPDGLLALGISKKEWRVLQYIIDGKSNDDIANAMFIAVSTVKTHINNLYKKLSVANRKEAIALGKELVT